MNKRRWITGSGAALVAGLVTAAALAPGYVAVEPRLDGSSVWVANSDAGSIGLANTANNTIERVVGVGAVDEVLSAATATVLVDRSASTVGVVVETDDTPSPTIPIPPGATVTTRDDDVLIVDGSGGDVWRTSVQAIGEGADLGEPLVELGRGGVAVFSETAVFAASPGLQRVLRIDESGETTSSDGAPVSPSAPQLQLSALGDEWVLYDAGSGVLSSRGWQARVDADGVRLQQPSRAADSVLVATAAGLERYQIGSGARTPLVSGVGGVAAAPLVTKSCTYAAWTNGTAWRACDGSDPVVLRLEALSANARPVIAQRGSATALSDPATGGAWAIDRGGAPVTGWQLEEPPTNQELPTDEERVEKEVEAAPNPPVAVDDVLGARPRSVTLLPVLLNDSDPNGDAFLITDVVVRRDDVSATVQPDGRVIRLEAPESGEVLIDYTISDGEQTATATATVTVADGDNSAPVLVNPPEATIEQGGSVALDALAGWVDPDGDALAVLEAAAEAPDRVTVRPDGRMEFRDGRAGTQRTVKLTVTDGVDTTTADIAFTVQAGAVPITADPVTAVTRPGQTVELQPLLASHGGSGTLALHNVVAKGLPVAPDYAAGTISVTPTEPGITRFSYVVTDGSATRGGFVVVRTLEGDDPSESPVTTPLRVTAPTIGNIDVSAESLGYDPGGGVLAVTAVKSSSDAVSTQAVDSDHVRIGVDGDAQDGATVEYTLSNGVRRTTGELFVTSRESATLQSPIARDDAAAVRPGGLVDVAVLENDEHPDGLQLTLDRVVAPPAQGLLFVDGDRLRYVAGSEPGTYSATYTVSGPDGQTASASVEIRVAPASGATNAAPQTPDIEARVVAGSSVLLSLPLSASDPNGDPVQLLGPSSAAALGFVTQVGASELRYQAGEYSSGTDEFRYRVADDQGGISEGLVRVVVLAGDTAQAPVAVADSAAMRPDSTLTVPVLDNDDDPAGLPLTVSAVSTETSGAQAAVVDGAVQVTAGPDEGSIGVLVTVENAAGSAATSWLSVDVRADAPLPAPDVADARVSIAAIADAETVRIDPLAEASVRDGQTDSLVASLPLASEGVTLRDDGLIDIEVGEFTRFVPFAVSRTDDTSGPTIAVASVPGKADALPQLRPGVAPLQTRSGETLEIALDDILDTIDGDGAILTDASAVEASPTDGTNPVVNERTLRFVPARGYYGPASMTFEVTDGEQPSDPAGRRATIVLPISVLPGDDVPLTVQGFTSQLEPGSPRDIDLARITRAPGPERLKDASWSLPEGVPPGFQASIDGSTLTVRALDRTPPGTTETVTVGVRDSAGAGVNGAITLSVISTTKPRVAPVADSITLQRGTSGEAQPLVNDGASNPFPDTPLRLGALRDAGASERGVRARIQGDALRVDVSPDAVIGSTIVRVQVLDATGDPRRGVWSPVTITVQDVPEAPAPPVRAVDDYVDGIVTMSITPPADNGSEITGYRIVGPGIDVDCGPEPRCLLDNLPAGTDVLLRAVAVNALGPSAESAPSESVRADRLPAVVREIAVRPGDAPASARVTWREASRPSGGTEVDGYLVRVTGGGTTRIEQVGAGERDAVLTGLSPGTAYGIEVAATNAAGVPDDAWRWPSEATPFTAVGEPGDQSVVQTGRDAAAGTVSVRWSAAEPAGSTTVRYAARLVPAEGAEKTSCTSGGDGMPVGTAATSATLSVRDGARVVVAVTADNGWFCSVSISGPVFGTPDAPEASQFTLAPQVRDNAQDLRLTRAPELESDVWIESRVRQSGASNWRRVAEGSWVTPPGGAFAYGRTDTRVEARTCAPSGSGGSGVCSDPVALGTFVPLSLQAVVDSCRPLAPLDVTAPENASARAVGEVEARYLVNGEWSSWRSAKQNVPARSTQVQARGVVTYGDSDGVRDPVPTAARCGL